MKREGCPLCTHGEHLFLFDRGRGGAFETVVCNGCGFVYVPQRSGENTEDGTLDTGAYRRHQNHDFSAEAIQAILTKEARAAANAERRYNNIKNTNPDIWSKKDGEIYDIGASVGFFLQHWLADGYSVSGCEPDEYYSEIAKKHFKLDIEPTFYENKPIKRNQYYVITLNHVLEHVVNPRQILQRIRAELRDDGYLYIEIPTIDSPYGGNLDRFFWIEHINYFSRPSLSAILESEGFEIIKYGRIGYFLWMTARKAPAPKPMPPLPIERPEDVRYRTAMHYLRYVNNELARLDKVERPTPPAGRARGLVTAETAKPPARSARPSSSSHSMTESNGISYVTTETRGASPQTTRASKASPSSIRQPSSHGSETGITAQLGKMPGAQKNAFLRDLARELDWRHADHLMRQLRQRLEDDGSWRFGGARIRSKFDLYSRYAVVHLGRMPTRYLDFGAGLHQPLAFSTLFWLHGAVKCVALDPDPKLVSGNADFIAGRTAQSLWDILCEVIAEPSAFGFEDRHWLDKLEKLDTAALRAGDLVAALRRAPLLRFCGSLEALPEDDRDFDFVTSQAVLEHVVDFEGVASELFRRTAPGGVHMHDVDFRDHRSFSQPDRYSHLDFLFTPEGDGGHCNRLRFSEVRTAFEAAGFVIVDASRRTKAVGRHIREQLAPQFSHLEDSDLETVGAVFVIRKP